MKIGNNEKSEKQVSAAGIKLIFCAAAFCICTLIKVLLPASSAVEKMKSTLSDDGAYVEAIREMGGRIAEGENAVRVLGEAFGIDIPQMIEV